MYIHRFATFATNPFARCETMLLVDSLRAVYATFNLPA